MARPDHRLPGHFHAPAGHHRRQRRAPRYSERVAHLLYGSAVGRRRLRPAARHLHAECGHPRRHARTKAGLHQRRRDLHRRLSRLRRSHLSPLPQPRPRRPGSRRGGHVRGLARDPLPGVPREGTRHRVRDLGGDDRRRGRDRAARRRRAHDLGRLALDLLRQSADRGDLRGGRPGVSPRIARRAARRLRPSRIRHVDGRAICAGARDAARKRLGLVERARARTARRRRGVPRRVRPPSHLRSRPRCSLSSST